MSIKKFNRGFFQFLNTSPTMFHAVENMKNCLIGTGFQQIYQNKAWQTRPKGSYFFIKDGGTIVAFTLADKASSKNGFRIIAAHTDSPGLQLKPRAIINNHHYSRLGVEIYGSPILRSWFDRDLSLAGRVTCLLKNGQLKNLLIDFQSPLLVIPSLAIHLSQKEQTKDSINRQKHMPPILLQDNDKKNQNFNDIVLKQLQQQYPDKKITEILASDIFCADCQPATLLGYNNEFITGYRLDNLLSCYGGLQSICQAKKPENRMLICTNHEECGSVSTSGANSLLVSSLFERLFPDVSARQQMLADSFIISADNAHAVHPNYPDVHDPEHLPMLNHGPVIKFNANQRYATNSITAGKTKLLAKDAGIPCQDFSMRSDLACGSTVGPVTSAGIGVETVDIGAPTLAMHSIREVTGAKDPYLLYSLLDNFFNRDSLPGVN